MEYDVQEILAFSPQIRNAWLSFHGLALLRLRVDISGAALVPVKQAGDHVLARFNGAGGASPFARGWMILGCGFPCVLNEPDIEIISR